MKLDRNTTKNIQTTISKTKTVDSISLENFESTYDADDYGEALTEAQEQEKSILRFRISFLYSDGSKYDLYSSEMEREYTFDLDTDHSEVGFDLMQIFNEHIKDKGFVFNMQNVKVVVSTFVFVNLFDFLSKIDTESIELKLKNTQVDFKKLSSQLSNKITSLEYQRFEFSSSQRNIYLANNTKFTGCIFNGIFMQNANIINSLEFNRCIFKDVFTLQKLKCKSLIIAYSNAESSFIFNHIEVYEIFELSSNSFQNLVSFYKFGFGGFINISSSRYAQGINFSNIYLLVRQGKGRGRGRASSNYEHTSLYKYEHVMHNIYFLAKLYNLDIKDLRTSISLIKQSLDSGGNSIDADKFYAMEMSIHFQEMKLWSVETGLRKVLFFVNWFISDYYQSFGKAILMFFLFNLLVSIYQVDGFGVVIDKTFSNMFIYYEMLSNFVNMKHDELKGKIVLALANTYFYFQIIRASRTGLKR